MRIRYLGWQFFAAGAGVLAASFLIARHFDPDRSLHRAWQSLFNAVEAQNAGRLRAQLDDNYRDRWGYTADSLANDARRAFFRTQSLRLTASQVQVHREQYRATITAHLKLEATGPEPVPTARVAVNSLFSPFVFEWRRDPQFPWTWKLTRWDHPRFEPQRFRHNF